MRRSFLPLFLLPIFAAPSLSAQSASLVRDINASPGTQLGSDARPSQLLAVGDKLFFVALSGDAGREVWVSDGTTYRTELLADVCPGLCGTTVDPVILGSQRGLVFWVARTAEDRFAPFQLWRSDGTRAGTFALTDAVLDLVLRDRAPRIDTAFAGGRLYFLTCPPEPEECGLWSTNGSRTGTHEVLRENPGLRNIRSLTGVGGRLFFLTDLGNRRALWVHDGTSGLALVDFAPSALSPTLLTAAGDRLFFVADDGKDRQELWVSDGTLAGTRAITRFRSSLPFSGTEWLAAIDGRIYFVANDGTHGKELWSSDGTETGTLRRTDFAPGDPFSNYFPPSRFAVIGGRAVFVASDGIAGARLWSTTGTSPSQVLLSNLCPGGCQNLDTVTRLVDVGGRLVFLAEDAGHGREPWRTDGTPQGTALVRDVCPGPCGSTGADLSPTGGAAFFPGREREGGGGELWRTDGTPAGTRRFTDFNSQGGADLRDGPPVAAGGLVFFAGIGYGDANRGRELWASDGTPGGTRPVADLFSGGSSAYPAEVIPLPDGVAFTAEDGVGQPYRRGIWRSAGTPESTFALVPPDPDCSFTDCDARDLAVALGALFYWRGDRTATLQLWKVDPAGTSAPVQLTSFPAGFLLSNQEMPLVELAGALYFLAPDQRGTAHTELWRTDGTVAGTRKVTDLAPDSGLADHLAAVGGRLYFTAGIYDHQLWISDGTAAGTRMLSHDVFEARNLPGFSRIGSQVLFLATRFQEELELWATDGTPEGTRYLRTLDPHSFGTPYLEQIEHGGAAYIATVDQDEVSLWRSDGTAAGTFLLHSFPLVGIDADPRPSLTALGDRVYFAADDGVHGTELWQTDGTVAGTTLLRDIIPGAAGSEPAGLYATGGRLYFSAGEPTHGVELWQSDGTAAGTRMVQDVAAQSNSSSPDHLTAAAGRLYFAADDGLTGRELWSLPLTGGGCQPSAAALCLNGGRFRVEASWTANQRSGPGQAVALTNDTGYFWFFGPENVEVIVKILDGRGLNDHFWVFYGALSDVEYGLKVTDTETGLSRLYKNLPGRLASVGDTEGFGRLGAFDVTSAELVAPASPPARVRHETVIDKAACQPGPTRLCLNQGRFAVDVRWQDFADHTGQGTAGALTADTGTFWFFGPENIELVVKVLDGTAVNDHFWVFYGALSNVEYELTVTDTATGKVNVYTNPKGRFASVADTGAF